MQAFEVHFNFFQFGLDWVVQIWDFFLQAFLKVVQCFDSGLFYACQLWEKFFVPSFENRNYAHFHVFPLLNSEISTFDSNARKFANFFCRFFISVILVRFESSHFLVISPYLSFISVIASLSSLTFVSILLISSVHFSYISSTLLVSSSSLSSFTWFCLWTVMAYSFCSIFINLSRFYFAPTVVLFFGELNSWSPKRAFDIFSIRF